MGLLGWLIGCGEPQLPPALAPLVPLVASGPGAHPDVRVPVLITTRNISRGASVTDDDLQVVSVPAGLVPPDAYTDPDWVVG